MEGSGSDEAAFPLPFQWDDGVFISPFVATDPETIHGLAGLVENLVGFDASPTASSLCDITLIDLGCGDGRVVAHVAAVIAQRRLPTVARISALGLDLDEGLIVKAKSSVAMVDGGEGPIVELRFEVQDLLQVSASDVLSKAASSSSRLHSEGRPQQQRDIIVVFAYLLPEALLLLKPLISALVTKVTCVVSNRWDIPYLTPWQRPAAFPGLNVYASAVCDSEEEQKSHV